MASIDNVVACGACVGCGACGVITGGKIPVKTNAYGVWQAYPTQLPAEVKTLASNVCPFADESPDETQIAADLFPDLPTDRHLGRYRAIFAGQVTNDDFLRGSSSGALTSWLLDQLLDRGLIDGVIHVGATGDADGLFSYVVSRTAEELSSRRKSVYYSTSMTSSLLRIRGDGKRYALVGVPCFVTAARLLARHDQALGSQLRYFVGLVCGHLKSPAFAKLLAWQVGVAPHELRAVDFRVKNPTRRAGEYDFTAFDARGEQHTAKTRSLLGGNWGHALFQLDACNFCDDIFAETADVVFGDAWLPAFASDWRGHNVVVARDAVLTGIIEDGAKDGTIRLYPLSRAAAAASQAGNFRHRREGLQLRLNDDLNEGKWTPRKRMKASGDLPKKRISVVRLRRTLAAESHGLFRTASEAHSLNRFVDSISPLIRELDKKSRVPLLERATRNLRRRLRANLSPSLIGREANAESAKRS